MSDAAPTRALRQASRHAGDCPAVMTSGRTADGAGLTRKPVNAIEAGWMVPSMLLALKLARVLEAPLETLFDLDDGCAIPSSAS
ncbi:MAG: hypothetical protein ABI229_07335, partial [Gemmatimonadaceae bacterium]